MYGKESYGTHKAGPGVGAVAGKMMAQSKGSRPATTGNKNTSASAKRQGSQLKAASTGMGVLKGPGL